VSAIPRAWLTLSRGELDRVFSGGVARALPEGEFAGTLIVPVPGLAHLIAAVIRLLVWRGKIFSRVGAREGDVVNKVTPLSFRSVPGDVRLEASWLDRAPAIVIDYSKKSWVAYFIRDEIREIQPGVYLGKVWWSRARLCDFALERTESRAGRDR
jgi:hypothetical protein